MKHYKKFIKYLSSKFNKPLLFPDISDKRLVNQWKEYFEDVKIL